MKHRLHKRPYRVHLALWVDCCRLAMAFIKASFVLCVQYWREWPSNKRSKLFVTLFNARVNWIRPATRVGTYGAIKASHKIFIHYFKFSKNVMLISVSCVTPEKITDYLYFKLRSLFLHGSMYPQESFCAERSLYRLACVQKWLFRYSRANWPTTISLTFQLLKVQPQRSML